MFKDYLNRKKYIQGDSLHNQWGVVKKYQSFWSESSATSDYLPFSYLGFIVGGGGSLASSLPLLNLCLISVQPRFSGADQQGNNPDPFAIHLIIHLIHGLLVAWYHSWCYSACDVWMCALYSDFVAGYPGK